MVKAGAMFRGGREVKCVPVTLYRGAHCEQDLP